MSFSFPVRSNRCSDGTQTLVFPSVCLSSVLVLCCVRKWFVMESLIADTQMSATQRWFISTFHRISSFCIQLRTPPNWIGNCALNYLVGAIPDNVPKWIQFKRLEEVDRRLAGTRVAGRNRSSDGTCWLSTDTPTWNQRRSTRQAEKSNTRPSNQLNCQTVIKYCW